jgi:hypothetical protein
MTKKGELKIFSHFSHIILTGGRTKIKQRRFWQYIVQSVPIKGVFINAHHSMVFENKNHFILSVLFLQPNLFFKIVTIT